MAIDKRLQVFDAEGNPVDYDILATDVKFNDGEDLPTKLAELEEEIGEGGYNPPEGGIPATDLAPAVQTSLGKADTAVQPGNLSAVATSGNYNDLSNKPTIPDVSGLATKTEVNTGLAGKVDKETGKSMMSDAEHTKLQNLPTAAELGQSFAGKQDTLTFDSTPTANSTNPVTSGGVFDAIEAAVDDVVVGQVSGAVIDNYNSTSGTDALSAAKGKDLNERLEDVEAYWTESMATNLKVVLQNLAFASGSAGQTAANAIISLINSAKTVTSISAVLADDSKTWYSGDTFAASDVVVTATYGNGTTKVLTTGYTVSPTTLSTGSNTITVTYGTLTTTVSVTATLNTITAITGVTMIQGATATIGEDSGDLDVADFISAYSVSYANGDTGTITDMNTISFVSGTTIASGTNTLTVQLGSDSSITYSVSVTGAAEQPAVVEWEYTGDTYSKSSSKSMTFDTPISVPNKLTISSTGTPLASSIAGTAIKEGVFVIGSGGSNPFTIEDGEVTATGVKTADGTSRTLTKGSIELVIDQDTGKCTGAVVGGFFYKQASSDIDLYYRTGLTYTFTFETES